MKIKKYCHGEGDFWQVMGPMFASEEVYKAQGGYPMFSDSSTVWYLAFEGDELIGWIATQPKANRVNIRFQYLLISDEIAQKLIETCIKDNMNEVMETVEFKEKAAPYLQCGFIERQQRGKKFIVLRREPG